MKKYPTTLPVFVLLGFINTGILATLPDPFSTDYLNITETSSPDINFNHALRPVSDIHLTGMSVMIDAEDLIQNLHAPYHNVHHIRRYHVFADEVVIRSPFHLPQTEVRIHARKLTFVDKVGEPRTYIRTTPLFNLSAPAEGADGGDGLDGGDVYCFAESLEIPADTFARFDLMGAGGQQPGPGYDGVDGDSMDEYSNIYDFPSINEYIAGTVYMFDLSLGGDQLDIFGEDDWPNNGTDALAGGRPGTGGRGGDMLTNQNLTAITNMAGGLSGPKGPNYSGGDAGMPNPSYHVSYNLTAGFPKMYTIVEGPRHILDGMDAMAPDPYSPFGNAGFYQQQVRSWFHPDVLDAIVPYATDAVTQDRDFVFDMLNDYLRLTDEFQETTEWFEMPVYQQSKVNQQETEMRALIATLKDTSARDWPNYR